MTKKRETVKPDPQDHAAIEREYGPLPANASDAEVADRYRLAQAAKLIRLYEPALRAGKAPAKGDAMDKIRRAKR